LEKGTPFSNAFAMHPEAFPSVITNLIRAGETSGNLELVLNQISQDLEKERELSSKVKSALTYPLILLITSFAMTFFLVTFLVPKMAQSFLNTGAKMPIYTEIILTVGMFLNKNLIIVLPVLIISIVGIVIFLRTVNGKKLVSSLGDKIPVVKNLTDKMALQRMTSVLSSLIKAGMPIIGALEITAEAVSHPRFNNALMRIARESLPKGVKIGDAFRQEKIFPAVLTNLMLVGEKAGHTEEILDSLALFYSNEIDAGLKTLVAFIEPMLLLLIGVIVGGLALAVIVPVYQMVGQF
jgi:type II secretory pathway component PulF